MSLQGLKEVLLEASVLDLEDELKAKLKEGQAFSVRMKRTTGNGETEVTSYFNFTPEGDGTWQATAGIMQVGQNKSPTERTNDRRIPEGSVLRAVLSFYKTLGGEVEFEVEALAV